MFRRLNELNFVIGLFFAIVALILLADTFFDNTLPGTINLYTGIVFFIFGVVMIMIRTNKDTE